MPLHGKQGIAHFDTHAKLYRLSWRLPNNFVKSDLVKWFTTYPLSVCGLGFFCHCGQSQTAWQYELCSTSIKWFPPECHKNDQCQGDGVWRPEEMSNCMPASTLCCCLWQCLLNVSAEAHRNICLLQKKSLHWPISFKQAVLVGVDSSLLQTSNLCKH